MLQTIATLLSWAVALYLIAVTALLAFRKQTGLTLIQHRTDMLPQVLLVRYAGLGLLARLAAWLNAPRLLFGMLLAFSVISLGDAFVYRRANHPFWLHLGAGVVAGVGAVLALFSF